MRKDTHQAMAPGFLRILGWGAVLGSVLLVAGNIVGSVVVPGHDFVADTVSDLAAGRFEIIQDVALYGYAVGLISLSLGVAHLHRGHARWTALCLTLMSLALCVVVIGARNEYGDGDNEGIVVHIYVVYLLGALFAAAFALAGRIGARLHPMIGRTSWACLLLWLIAAPIFFLLPTGWDGLWERGLGVICVVWTAVMGLALLRIGRRH